MAGLLYDPLPFVPDSDRAAGYVRVRVTKRKERVIAATGLRVITLTPLTFSLDRVAEAPTSKVRVYRRPGAAAGTA